jgi:RNA-directed DNA polymerase
MVRVEIDGKVKTFWGAADALVLKAIALVLGDEVAPHLSEHCWHLKGRGLKAAVSKTQSMISGYKFVLRSDVDSYYASMTTMCCLTCSQSLSQTLSSSISFARA